MKMERRRSNDGTGEIPGVWSKPDLVAWAQKLGIDKIATHI